MPLPIRPVRETEDGVLGKTYSDPFAFVPMSDMQKQILEHEAAPHHQSFGPREAKSYKDVSRASRKQLFEIWNSREPEILKAQASLNMEPSFPKPQSMSSPELMRLVSEGLITRHDGGRISFTRIGKQALNREVMDQPNSFMENQTRNKALKIAQTGAGVTQPLEETMDKSNEAQEVSGEAYQEVNTQVQDLIDQWNAIQAQMEQAKKIQDEQMNQAKSYQVPTQIAASKDKSKKIVEAAILEKMSSCDIIEDASRLQRLDNVLRKLDAGYLTEEEVNLILE